MTLPATGSISFSNIAVETGNAANTSINMSWVKAIMKSPPASLSTSNLYSLAYYLQNSAGNCNNGHCNCTGNCGDINCTQCYAAGAINCVNCDAAAYLQPNCNCACTYNCSPAAASYNCNCDCNCVCEF